MEPLPLRATLDRYLEQARDLLQGHAAGNAEVLRLIHEHHPRFLDREIKWLPLHIPDQEIRMTPFDLEDARLALARWYSFRDWTGLAQTVAAVEERVPGICEFELAAEAVITGDEETLAGLLRNTPRLVQARSSRVTCFDPPVHRATLLHYVAANGIETYRQRTPKNAVRIASLLLDAGSDPNALASMYGGECTTLSMLVSSSPPAQAGLQIKLIETLLDYRADPNGTGTGQWVTPVLTALAFGFVGAAHTLARRGARLDRLATVAGLGRIVETRTLLPAAEPVERHRALALAAQLGHAEIVAMLLDAGESPDRYNPEGLHAHATPLHHAALNGHLDVVRLLVQRGARLDIADKLWKSTPQGWAEYAGQTGVAEYLRANQ